MVFVIYMKVLEFDIPFDSVSVERWVPFTSKGPKFKKNKYQHKSDTKINENGKLR